MSIKRQFTKLALAKRICCPPLFIGILIAYKVRSFLDNMLLGIYALLI